MKNQAYYDRLDLDESECHVEQQFRDSFWFKVFALLGGGVFIGWVVYSALFMGA